MISNAHILILAAVFLPFMAHSQEYPVKPIRLIVPYPPGGPVDFVARTIQKPLSSEIGQPVIIDNKPGAGGNIGTADLARSAADGYTLSIVYETHATANIFFKSLSFDVFKSFDYISLLGHSPMVLISSKGSEIGNYKDLIDKVKNSPTLVNQAVTGPGPSSILKTEILNQKLGAKVTYIPYKGSSEALAAVMSNQVDILLLSLPTIMGTKDSDKYNIIFTGGNRRLSQLPNVPMIKDIDSQINATAWIGLVAPKGLPNEVAEKIQMSIHNVLQQKNVSQDLNRNGFVPSPSTQTEFLRKLKEDSDKASQLVADGVLKVN